MTATLDKKRHIQVNICAKVTILQLLLFARILGKVSVQVPVTVSLDRQKDIN